MILRAEPFGSRSATRYVIIDVENKTAWDGKNFVSSWKLGRMYAKPADACCEMQRLLKEAYEHLPRRTYTVELSLEVFGDVDAQQVADWLYRSTVLHMQMEKFGNGPDDSLVCPTIHWGSIAATDDLDELTYYEPQEDNDETFED